MQKHFRNVPGSLNALLVLEAAVRHGSFTKAGAELNLTQSTVSRHIAVLEDRLERPLFVRNNNQLVATPRGQQLADAAALGIGHVESAWQDIAGPEPADDLVLACTYGFAEYWLLPRFPRLKEALGGVPIRLATSDWMDCLDMDRVDVAIAWDLSHAPDRPNIPLFREEVVPVCSPDYLKQNPAIAEAPGGLLDANLIHFDVQHSGLQTWSHWFAKFGIAYKRPRDSFFYDAYPFVLDAVIKGEGVALGWRHFIDGSMEDGLLVKAGPSVRTSNIVDYIQYRSGGPHQDRIRTLIDWFRSEV